MRLSTAEAGGGATTSQPESFNMLRLQENHKVTQGVLHIYKSTNLILTDNMIHVTTWFSKSSAFSESKAVRMKAYVGKVICDLQNPLEPSCELGHRLKEKLPVARSVHSPPYSSILSGLHSASLDAQTLHVAMVVYSNPP